MRRRSLALLLIAAAAVIGAVSASVFVYYPVTATASYVNPPIILEGGTNANQADLGGNTIEVNLGANKTSATITLHPTYQKTWYHNILKITNTDTNNAYYVAIRISGGLSSVSGSVEVRVYDSAGNLKATVTPGSASNWIQLNAGDYLTLDIVYQIGEGQTIAGKNDTITIDVIYSNQNTEQPPA